MTLEGDDEASGSCGSSDLGKAYPELVAEGWQYRWCGEGDRLEEQRALYEELGFETRIVPLALDEADEADETDGACRSCFRNQPDRYRVLFTRPASGSEAGEASAAPSAERPAASDGSGNR